MPKFAKSKERKPIFPQQSTSPINISQQAVAHNKQQILTRRQVTEDHKVVTGFLPSSPPQRSHNNSNKYKNKLSPKQLAKAIYSQDRRFGNVPSSYISSNTNNTTRNKNKDKSISKQNVASHIISTFQRALRPSQMKQKNIPPSPRVQKHHRRHPNPPHHNKLTLQINIKSDFIQEDDQLRNYKEFLMRPPSGPTVIKSTVYDRHNLSNYSDNNNNNIEDEDVLLDNNNNNYFNEMENRAPSQDEIIQAYNNQNSMDRWFHDEENDILIEKDAVEIKNSNRQQTRIKRHKAQSNKVVSMERLNNANNTT